MKNNTKIMQKNRTIFLSSPQLSIQPNIDYGRLFARLQKNTLDEVDDLRKEAFYTKTDLSSNDDPALEQISSDSLIPIPGMLIEYENSESGDSVPMSNWVAPHGPQWGPALR